ncbi:MAG: A24 family peptidase [Clostridia bacterium]|nr:A24 family peptidase [Clostridia bacterium]
MTEKIIMLIILILVLISPTIEDIKERQIRNIYFFLIFCIRGVYLCYAQDEKEIVSSFVSFVAAGLIFVVCYFITHDGIGGGDIKLLVSIAFYLGFELFLRDLFLISIASVLFSIFLLATKQATKKTELPFVPFILLGTVASTLIEVVR